MLSKIEDAMSSAPLGWILWFFGEDQSRQLAELHNDLKRKTSSTGDGKRFVSGFSYWGVGPTMAWVDACQDRFYPVMRESIRSFRERWQVLLPSLGDQAYHYVSLGVGTGHKDRDILNDLRRINPEAFYFPVDMSSEMLRVGIGKVRELGGTLLESRRLIPVQIDFSEENNVKQLRGLLDRLLEGQPVLFSLLGNTLANFDDDKALLQTLSELVRPHDRLLVEVAHTNELSEQALLKAAEEYGGSHMFKLFVTSALFQNTDLHVDLNCVSFVGEREQDRAILIKVLYRNQTDTTMNITLPNRNEKVEFPKDDTIRLALLRKYTTEGVDELIRESGFLIVQRSLLPFRVARQRFGFGTDLLLLEPNPKRLPTRNEGGSSKRQKPPAKKTTILFLAADPTDASRLRLGEEAREIDEKLRLARYRQRFQLVERFAVRPVDTIQALLDVKPQIVHFSGHGIATGELAFENALGEVQPVEPSALAALFARFSDQVRCVVLNACYSEQQARAISQHIDYVIGMNKAIGDKAAIAFATGFYQALGANQPIEEAYEFGVVQIGLQGRLPEHLTPVLMRRG